MSKDNTQGETAIQSKGNNADNSSGKADAAAKPANEQPVDGHAANVHATNEQPAEEHAANEQTAGEQPTDGHAAEEQPTPVWGRHVSDDYEDPNKVAPKEDMHTDGSLELATMSRKERRAEKKRRFRETTADMTGKEKFQYFIFAYKAEILIPALVIVCICAVAIGLYKISLPTALSYAIVNCEDLDALDTTAIDEDFSDYYGYDDSYGYTYVLDIKLSTTATDYDRTSDSQSSNYIGFPTMCAENYYDIIITDKDGLEFLNENAIVFELGDILDTDVYNTLRKRSLVKSLTDSSGISTDCAIDISDTAFAEKLNPGYDEVYLCFPGNSEENIENAMKFLNYVFELGL